MYGGDYEGKTPDGVSFEREPSALARALADCPALPCCVATRKSAGKIAGCSQDVESDVTVTSDGSSAEAPADDGGSGGGVRTGWLSRSWNSSS